MSKNAESPYKGGKGEKSTETKGEPRKKGGATSTVEAAKGGGKSCYHGGDYGK